MKKLNLLTFALIGGIVFWSSCSKSSDNHDDDCHPCHIAIENAAGLADSIAWDITDANGEVIIFCGDDLHNAEESWTIPAGQYLVSDDLEDTLWEGTYTHMVDGYEIHCH